MPYKRVKSPAKSLTASTASQDERDAKRWLIIGAYQAGANERQIARMCKINQPSVRRTILNFKKTGSPTLPRGLTPKEKSKPFLEYDGEGNLIDSDDEESTDIASTSLPTDSPLKAKIRARRPSAKDLIAYVLSKAQQPEKSVFVKHEEQEKWRPPTPPRDSNCNDKQIKATNDTRSILSPPVSEPSISPKQEHEFIRGYETWTMDDDKILMAHVLTRLSGCRWKEAEAKLRGKHSADVCEKRWEVLRSLLIRGANKSGTQGW
ncbi:COPII coat GTPase [Mucor velutinosus]|uniref:COPII coat GTPase n=1 Tax=Mucor velutinosus TaxID=708070 RepID=A0AAN7HWY0_9FUNG|nr:COPII coat GTPase [Mucor velutinosus]